MTDKPDVKWEGLIRTIKADNGEYKVVRKAEGMAPWGSPIKAERNESEMDNSILISLPEQKNWHLAILDGTKWDIWITPSGELHVVNTVLGSATAEANEYYRTHAIANEYLMLTQANGKLSK